MTDDRGRRRIKVEMHGRPVRITGEGRSVPASSDFGEARVEELVTAIFSKINASNRAEAVAIALRKHLLTV